MAGTTNEQGTSTTEWAQAYETHLARELDEWSAKAIERYNESVAAFAKRVIEYGPSEALRWKAEGVLAAEVEHLAALTFRTDGSEHPATVVLARIKRDLREKMSAGLRSQSSGLMTNEVYKACGVAALELLDGFSGLASCEHSAHWQANHSVAAHESATFQMERKRLGELKEAQSRMRSEARKLDAQEHIDAQQARVDRAQAAYDARLAAVGAPAEGGR